MSFESLVVSMDRSLAVELPIPCSICNDPVTKEDFALGLAVGVGREPLKTAAHLHHFFDPLGDKTVDYEKNVNLLALDLGRKEGFTPIA